MWQFDNDTSVLSLAPPNIHVPALNYGPFSYLLAGERAALPTNAALKNVSDENVFTAYKYCAQIIFFFYFKTIVLQVLIHP